MAAIESAAQNISCDGWERATGADCNKDLSNGFRVMQETAIVKSGKMDVMERGQLDSVVNEQAIAQIGLTHAGGPGSPWENGYCASLNGKLREECLNGEIFYSLKEARIVIEQWRQQYNRVRPHAALGYRPPAPGA